MIRTKINISLLFLAIIFGAIGCNPGIVDVPPTQVTNASAYFWSSNSFPVTFQEIDSVTLKTSTIMLSKVSDTSNTFIIGQQGTTNGNITCTIDTGSVRISGISSHSFIPLPANFVIKSRIHSILNSSAFPINHVIAFGNLGNVVIASSNDSGVYYSTDNGKVWSHPTIPFGRSDNPVAAFAQLKNTVYAGTKNGDLYQSTNNGANWDLKFKVGKGIVALAISTTTSALYISNSDSIYRITLPINATSPGIGFINKRQIHIISLASNSPSNSIDSERVVGVSDSGKVYYRMGGYADWQPTQISYARSVIATSDRFYCSTERGIYTSLHGIDWSFVDSLTEGIFAYDASQLKVIATNRYGHMESITNDKIDGPITDITGKLVNDISASSGNYYVATDSGIYLGSSTFWSALTSGPFISHTETSEIPGEIVLLKSIVGSSVFDSSWAADTLVSTLQKSLIFPITGRIIAHLDSLNIGSTSYPDVLCVRYTDEDLTSSTITPYWVIYYAKNSGPILISQMFGQKTLTKAIRQR